MGGRLLDKVWNGYQRVPRPSIIQSPASKGNNNPLLLGNDLGLGPH